MAVPHAGADQASWSAALRQPSGKEGNAEVEASAQSRREKRTGSRPQPSRRLRSMTAAEISDRYFDAYLDAFYQQAHPECEYADELLDIVSYATFDIHTARFHPASKAELFQTFVDPLDLPDGSQHVRTLVEAETSLRYLVKKKMMVVDGDVVSTHPRFACLVGASGESPIPHDADAPSEIP
jgi:hypothetical protein